MTEILPHSPEQKSGALWSADALAAHRKSLRELALFDQLKQTLIFEDYTVRPTIGRSGGADAIGWELIPAPGAAGPIWYLATRELAIEAIPRHKAMYA